MPGSEAGTDDQDYVVVDKAQVVEKEENENEKARFVTMVDEFHKSTVSGLELTENGGVAVSESGLGSTLLAIFDKAIRRCDLALMGERVKEIFAKGTTQDKVDMCCLAFQTRDPRKGKGEKKLGLDLFLLLPEELQVALAPCIPEHGSWKDVRLLLTNEKVSEVVKTALLGLFTKTLRKDFDEHAASEAEDRRAGLSLCAKYALRERVSGEKRLLKRAFEDIGDIVGAEKPYKVYRQRLASLRKSLDVTEIKMSGSSWSSISPRKVPSECGRRHRKAFLNEKVKGVVSKAHADTGNRHPDNEDRVQCRRNFLEAASKKELKSTVVHANNLVSDAYKASDYFRDFTNAEVKVVDAQALGHIAHVRQSMISASGDVNLGKLVPVVDVSGSMSGTPMYAAIGLGMLSAFLAHPAFSNRVITFHDKPSWVQLDPEKGWCENVGVVQGSAWGHNTNVVAVVDLILNILNSAKPPLKPSEVPGIIIFSDMQFDRCGGLQWETQSEAMKRKFRQAGIDLVGEPYELQITFWNLRGNTSSFVSTASASGVTMLSGFSSNLMKVVLEGSMIANPVTIMYNIIRHDDYKDIRDIATKVLS